MEPFEGRQFEGQQLEKQRFEGQVAVITGGGQGIGLGIAKRLGSEGATLALLDKNGDLLETTGASLQGGCADLMTSTVDVTNEDDVGKSVRQVMERFGRIDILVTAAGIMSMSDRPTHLIETSDFEKVLDVNLKGMFFTIRAVLPHMLEADYGRIVNIASVSGLDGNEGMMPYTASKAGVIGMTLVIGREYAHTGITCNAISPALIQTSMTTEGLDPEHYKRLTARVPMGRTGTLEEVAAVAAFVASRECSFTTGFSFDASGGRAVY